MSIVKVNPARVEQRSTTPITIKDNEKSNFSVLVPETSYLSLLQYVEGYPWTVNYYGQILSESNTLNHFDPTLPNLNQPYYLIKNLIINVSSPLSSNYDQSTGITTVEGSSLLPYGVIPNVGDLFSARVDNEEDAIFIITNVIRKTYRKDTLYEINYQLHFYKNTDPDFYDKLNASVTEKKYFNARSYSLDPMHRNVYVTEQKKEAIERLDGFIRDSKAYYYSRFFDQKHRTLLLPHEEYSFYDPKFIDFVKKTVDHLPNFALYHTSNDKMIHYPSIFDAILQRSQSIMRSCVRRYVFVNSEYLSMNYRLGTLRAIGIDYVLYPHPEEPYVKINQYPTQYIYESEYHDPYTEENSKGYEATVKLELGGISEMRQIHDLDMTSYLVSESFYNDLPTSFIEHLILKHIHSEPLAKEDVLEALRDYYKWPVMQQFYFLPLIWLMDKISY